MSKFVPRFAFILAAAALTCLASAVAFESKCAQDSDTQLSSAPVPQR